MRRALAKKLLAGSITAVTTLFLGLAPAMPAFAQSYPTVKFAGGDVLAGGWFGSTCNQAGNPYQDAAYTNSGAITDNSAGGIFTYSGSSSDFAAFALGVIDKSAPTPPNGFNSSAVTGGAADRLSFANINYLSNGGYIGGNWDGGVQNSAQCIPNYFDDKKPTGLTATAIPLPTSISGTQYYTGNDSGNTAATLLSSDTAVNAGADVVVFITGNVYINHNIEYTAHDATSIPKFALIAKGNIYVDPSVTRLDGLYISQPDSASFGSNSTVSANTGDFWSCHNSDSTITKLDSSYLAGCGQTLTVNGAVITKRAFLVRVDASNNAKEVFNYTPEMVIGGAFFPGSTSGSGSASGQPVFDRIISLPPVF